MRFLKYMYNKKNPFTQSSHNKVCQLLFKDNVTLFSVFIVLCFNCSKCRTCCSCMLSQILLFPTGSQSLLTQSLVCVKFTNYVQILTVSVSVIQPCYLNIKEFWVNKYVPKTFRASISIYNIMGP